MKKSKKSCSLFFLLLIGISIIFYFGYRLFGPFRDNWKQRTTPLSQETISVLCKNFNLEPEHRLCSGKKDVYGPDFYKTIRDTFRPYEEYNIESREAATYDEVEERIGTFKNSCLYVEKAGDGFAYFRCYYDLRGDEEFIIDIMFTYPDNAVFRINTPMGNDY